MNAAETSASSAMADWMLLTVVWRSCTTAAIETFMRDVSTTSTNIAIASRMASRWLPASSPASPGGAASVMGDPRSQPAECCRSVKLRHHPAGVMGRLEFVARRNVCPPDETEQHEHPQHPLHRAGMAGQAL